MTMKPNIVENMKVCRQYRRVIVSLRFFCYCKDVVVWQVTTISILENFASKDTCLALIDLEFVFFLLFSSFRKMTVCQKMLDKKNKILKTVK